MTVSTRRRVVLGIGLALLIAFIVVAWLEVDGWDAFQALSPLQRFLAVIGVASMLVGILAGVDQILLLLWPPPLDTDKIRENFNQQYQKLWEEQLHSLEKQWQGLSAEEVRRRIEEAHAHFQQTSNMLGQQYTNDINKAKALVDRGESEPLKEALSLLQKGKTDEAERELESIVNRGEDNRAVSEQEAAQAARILATLSRLQDVTRAAHLYERAATLDDNIRNWIDFGDTSLDAANLVETHRANLVEAREAYRQATELAQAQEPSARLPAARERLLEVLKQVAERLNVIKVGKLRDRLEPCREGLVDAQRLLSDKPDAIDTHRELDATTLATITKALADARSTYFADARTAYENAFADEIRLDEQGEAVPLGVIGDARKRFADLLETLGDQHRREGKPVEALAMYRHCLKQREVLASTNSGNVDFQRDLAVTQEKIGDLLLGSINPLAVLRAHRDQAIAEARYDANADNPTRQRDLAACREKLAAWQMRMTIGPLNDSLAAYGASREILEKLGNSYPPRGDVQKAQRAPDLAALHDKIGDVQAAQGHIEQAANSYSNSLAISNASPAIHDKRGDALLALDRREEALESYKTAHRIRGDATNANPNGHAKRGSAVSHIL